jgi:hypothetical protein
MTGDERKEAIGARLTIVERRAFNTLTARTVREVREKFHLAYDASAQHVLDAVAEYFKK